MSPAVHFVDDENKKEGNDVAQGWEMEEADESDAEGGVEVAFGCQLRAAVREQLAGCGKKR